MFGTNMAMVLPGTAEAGRVLRVLSAEPGTEVRYLLHACYASPVLSLRIRWYQDGLSRGVNQKLYGSCERFCYDLLLLCCDSLLLQVS